MSVEMIRLTFLVAALYDVLLGLAFGLFFKPIYAMFGVTLPNHDAYVQLSAILVLIFGIGFYMVYRRPHQGRPIIVLGILMKLGFAAVVLGHLVLGSIPSLYVPFAVLDLVFAVAFVAAYVSLEPAVTGESCQDVPTSPPPVT